MPLLVRNNRAMNQVMLATANPHKVDEMRAIFSELLPGFVIRGLADAAPVPLPEPPETGKTFLENATIKAVAYARATGQACLADDSGLEIDALGGRPGVISSHYCTDGREAGMTRSQRDSANNQRVLTELRGVWPEDRTGRFVCVMVIADPTGKVLATARGEFPGRIGEDGQVPRGAHGFGYDPLFLVGPEFDRTSSELDPSTKNRLSHRRKAAEQLARIIQSL